MDERCRMVAECLTARIGSLNGTRTLNKGPGLALATGSRSMAALCLALKHKAGPVDNEDASGRDLGRCDRVMWVTSS